MCVQAHQFIGSLEYNYMTVLIICTCIRLVAGLSNVFGPPLDAQS